jgi:hypothetical protein
MERTRLRMVERRLRAQSHRKKSNAGFAARCYDFYHRGTEATEKRRRSCSYLIVLCVSVVILFLRCVLVSRWLKAV